MLNKLLRLISISFAIAIFSASAKAQQPSTLLAGISRCGANAVLMNAYHKQNNQLDEAGEMEHAAYAYAKTTLDIGLSEGLSREEVIAMNKASNKDVGKEFRDNSELFLKEIGSKNKSCLYLLRANPNVAEIFGMHYRESN
jgi:hypothetical protein